MKMSENISDLSKALTAVQAALEPARFNAMNPYFKSKYADLGSVFEACRHLLADNGLSISQFPGTPNTEFPAIALTTVLMHESGQWIQDTLVMPIAKASPQDVGSALTYARRYVLSSIIGIVADEDDDANRAQHAPPKREAQAAETPAPQIPVNTAVTVRGKHDEKPGTVTGYDGDLLIVSVDGKKLKLSADKVIVVGQAHSPLFGDGEAQTAGNGAYSE
jgi:hypothetical protein